MVKYSVIIPTKNRMHLCNMLIQSIDKSILNSRLGPNDFEIIVVDDSGIRHEYTSSVVRVRILVNKRRHNAAHSRNRGSKVASGKYLVFFDDDIILPLNYFATLDSITEKLDFDILGCRVYPMANTAVDLFFSLNYIYARKFGYLAAVVLVIKREFFMHQKFDEAPEIEVTPDLKYFFGMLHSTSRILYSRKLYVTHEKVSLSELVKRTINYAKHSNKVLRQVNGRFSDLRKNRIVDLRDESSLTEKYRTLPFLMKAKLLGLAFIFLSILICYNPLTMRDLPSIAKVCLSPVFR